MRWYEPLLHDLKVYGLAALSAFVVPAAVVYFVPPFVKGQEALIFVLGIFALGFVVAGIILWRLTRDPLAAAEKQTMERLQGTVAAGEALGVERTGSLSEPDRQEIRRLKLFSWVGLPFGLGVGLLVLWGITNAKLESPYPLLITSGAFILFGYLTYAYSKIFDRMLLKGEKTVIEGIVTRRYKRRYGRSLYYVLVIGTIEVKVFRHNYLSCRAGDHVLLEVLRSFGDWNLRMVKRS